MKRYLVATSLALLAAVGLASVPMAWGKPADLPEDETINCTYAADDDESIAADPVEIDSLSPMLVQAWLAQWLEPLAALLAAPADPQARQVRREFEAAERDRLAGDLEKARLEYQRVHLLAPTTRLGRLAIDRITQIEQRQRDASEESEPQESGGDLRDRCQPLGLFELTY